MRRRQTNQGFTLIELMIAIFIVSIAVAMAVPNFTRYRLREHAREGATLVASALKEARLRAIRSGTQQFVIFNPSAAPAGTLLRRVQDTDTDWSVSAPDIVEDIPLPPNFDTTQVTPYGVGNKPFSSAPRPAEDEVGGTIDTLTDGAGFQNGAIGGEPAVGFDSRGMPVDPNNPTTWGSGQGVFYMTDGVASVFAVVVGPLGEIRILTLHGAANDWI